MTKHESHAAEIAEPSGEPARLVGIKSAVALSLLDQSPNGVALATAAGAVRYLNRVAETMTALDDGLAIRDGLLVAARPAEQGRLVKALARAADRVERRSRSALIVRRPSLRLPYALVVAPFCPRGLGDGGAPLALVTIADLDRRTNAVSGRLSELFGLSEAEARVAVGIANGDPPADVALRAGIRLSTVRSQLQAALRKTGARGQVDLVRIVHAIPPTGRD